MYKFIWSAVTVMLTYLLIFSTAYAQTQLCTLFTQESLESWGPCSFWPNITGSTTDQDSIGGVGDYYLLLEDLSGASWLCSGQSALNATASPYIGDWSSYPSGSTFCFDVRAFYLYTAPNFKPLFSIRGGTGLNNYLASFKANSSITIANKWVHFCAPIHTAGTTLPINASGTWNISIINHYGIGGRVPVTGSQAVAAWNDLLNNVVDVMISADVTNSPTERVGYDNMCLTQGSTGLKVCKEAGEGVTVGTLFDFIAGDSSVSVPAGPMPGGYCKVVPGSFAAGDLTIQETGPAGFTVTGISVAPSGRLVGAPDLPGKQVTVNLGSGITEVTFTNERSTGWLEICKEGDTSGNFSFTISPSLGSGGPFTVPAGVCTPAIEVPKGTITITEVAISGVTMLSCRTIPADRQGDCNPDTRTSEVKIIPGDISTQTIAFIENRGAGETTVGPVK